AHAWEGIDCGLRLRLHRPGEDPAALDGSEEDAAHRHRAPQRAEEPVACAGRLEYGSALQGGTQSSWRMFAFARSMSSVPRPESTVRIAKRAKPAACSALLVGGSDSSCRSTTTSSRAGPSWARNSCTADSRSLGSSTRKPRMPTASETAAKFGLLRSVAWVTKPAAFISSSTKLSESLL